MRADPFQAVQITESAWIEGASSQATARRIRSFRIALPILDMIMEEKIPQQYQLLTRLARLHNQIGSYCRNAGVILAGSPVDFSGYHQMHDQCQLDLLEAIKQLRVDPDQVEPIASETFLKYGSEVDPVYSPAQSKALIKKIRSLNRRILEVYTTAEPAFSDSPVQNQIMECKNKVQQFEEKLKETAGNEPI